MRETDIEFRKRQFADLLKFITERGGWPVSVPGDPDMRMECLPGSPLPDALRAMGYECEPTGETRERLLSNAITERLVRTSSGAPTFATEGSTAKIALRITHPGFATVEDFGLRADVR